MLCAILHQAIFVTSTVLLSDIPISLLTEAIILRVNALGGLIGHITPRLDSDRNAVNSQKARLPGPASIGQPGSLTIHARYTGNAIGDCIKVCSSSAISKPK